MDVDVNVFIFFDDINRIFNFSEPALTQNIKFKKPDVFRFQHAELCGGIALWRKACSAVSRNRLFGNDNAAGMYAQVAGKARKEFTVC